MLKTAGEWHHKVMFLNMPQKCCQKKKTGKLKKKEGERNTLHVIHVNNLIHNVKIFTK